jgi:hypothetical protein
MIAAWEAAHGGATDSSHLGLRGKSKDSRDKAVRSTFSVVLRAVATACCVLAVVIGVQQLRPSGEIAWTDAEIVQEARYRGTQGEDVLPRYSHAEMKALTVALRESVEFQYRDLAAQDVKAGRNAGRAGWILSTRVQELDEGRISIQVQAFVSKGEEPVKEWLKNYADAQSFQARVYEYSRQIAQDLLALRSSDTRTN